MTRIAVTIDRLVLRGIDPGNRPALVDALYAELSRILADPATGMVAATSRRIPVLRMAGLPMELGQPGARQLAAGIARAIGQGVKP